MEDDSHAIVQALSATVLEPGWKCDLDFGVGVCRG